MTNQERVATIDDKKLLIQSILHNYDDVEEAINYIKSICRIDIIKTAIEYEGSEIPTLRFISDKKRATRGIEAGPIDLMTNYLGDILFMDFPKALEYTNKTKKKFNMVGARVEEWVEGATVYIFNYLGKTFVEISMKDGIRIVPRSAIRKFLINKFCDPFKPFTGMAHQNVYCWVFKYQHPSMKPIKPFEKEDLILIGGFNKRICRPIASGYVRSFAKTYGFRTPSVRKTNLNENYNDFLNLTHPMEKGVIVIDRSNDKMMKINNPLYKIVSSAVSGNKVTLESLSRLVMHGEIDYRDITRHYTCLSDILELLNYSLTVTLSEASTLWSNYSRSKCRKEFAMKVKNLELSPLLFNIWSGHAIEYKQIVGCLKPEIIAETARKISDKVKLKKAYDAIKGEGRENGVHQNYAQSEVVSKQ
jgi:hypothetical protein